MDVLLVISHSGILRLMHLNRIISIIAATSLSRRASMYIISFRLVLPLRSFLYAFLTMPSSSIWRYRYLYCLWPVSCPAGNFCHSSFLRINNYSYGIFFLLSPTDSRCDRFTACPVSDSFPLIFPVMASKTCSNVQRCRKRIGFWLIFICDRNQAHPTYQLAKSAARSKVKARGPQPDPLLQ